MSLNNDQNSWIRPLAVAGIAIIAMTMLYLAYQHWSFFYENLFWLLIVAWVVMHLFMHSKYGYCGFHKNHNKMGDGK
jgi:hypothetical protein